MCIYAIALIKFLSVTIRNNASYLYEKKLEILNMFFDELPNTTIKIFIA